MGDTHKRLWNVTPRIEIGSKSLGILEAWNFEGMSLFGVSPAKAVPAGGSWRGVYHVKFGVRKFSGDFVIFEGVGRAVVVLKRRGQNARLKYGTNCDIRDIRENDWTLFIEESSGFVIAKTVPPFEHMLGPFARQRGFNVIIYY